MNYKGTIYRTTQALLFKSTPHRAMKISSRDEFRTFFHTLAHFPRDNYKWLNVYLLSNYCSVSTVDCKTRDVHILPTRRKPCSCGTKYHVGVLFFIYLCNNRKIENWLATQQLCPNWRYSRNLYTQIWYRKVILLVACAKPIYKMPWDVLYDCFSNIFRSFHHIHCFFSLRFRLSPMKRNSLLGCKPLL